MKEQYDLAAEEQLIVVPEIDIGALEEILPPSPEELFAAYLGFTRAFHLWFHGAHNLTKGTGFAGDHVDLYGRIYIEVQDVIDQTIEKAVGIFQDESLACPTRITSDALIVLGGWESPAGQSADRIADLAQKYAELFVTMDENIAMALDEAGALTYGLDNHLAGLADAHEAYVYLLNQRTKHL